jgi:hypothetical protein
MMARLGTLAARPGLLLSILIVLGVGLRVATALALPNVHHPDEIYQALEPAHRLLTGWGVVTWEWREGIRSWLLPGVLAGLMYIPTALGASGGVALGVVYGCFAALSASVIVVGYRLGQQAFGLAGALLVGGVCVVWPDLVLFGPKASTDAIAADLLIVAAYLGHRTNAVEPGRLARHAFVTGLVAGAVFCIRFQMAFALAAIAVWTCRRDLRGRWLAFVAGAALPVILEGVLDFYTLGSPLQSIWKNAWVNVVENRSAQYGVESPFFYFGRWIDLWGGATAPIAVLFLVGARKAPLLAICAAAIWLSHLPLGHKEARFLFPSIPMILIVAALGTCGVARSLSRAYPRVSEPAWTGAVLAGWIAVAITVGLAVGFRTEWRNERDALRLQAEIRGKHDVCGIGLVAAHWVALGGYAWFDQPAPIDVYGEEPPFDAAALARTADIRAFNYAVTPLTTPIAPGFSVVRCEGDLCLQHRSGGCVRDRSAEINNVLVAHHR